MSYTEYRQPPPNTSAVGPDRILALFRGGMDTKRIALLLRMPEKRVEQLLHRALDRELENRRLADEAGI